MAGATSTYGLPYPELVDIPDGPAAVQALAEATEDELVRIDAATADLPARVTELETRTSGVVPIATAGFTGTLSWERSGGVASVHVSANDADNGGWPAGVGLGILPAEICPPRSTYFLGLGLNNAAPVAVYVAVDGTVVIVLGGNAGVGGVLGHVSWVIA